MLSTVCAGPAAGVTATEFPVSEAEGWVRHGNHIQLGEHTACVSVTGYSANTGLRALLVPTEGCLSLLLPGASCQEWGVGDRERTLAEVNKHGEARMTKRVTPWLAVPARSCYLPLSLMSPLWLSQQSSN